MHWYELLLIPVDNKYKDDLGKTTLEYSAHLKQVKKILAKFDINTGKSFTHVTRKSAARMRRTIGHGW